MPEQRETATFVSRELSEQRASHHAPPEAPVALCCRPAQAQWSVCYTEAAASDGAHKRGKARALERVTDQNGGVQRWPRAVFAGALCARHICTERTADATQLFTYDLDLDETLGRLKFVENLFPGAAAVFGTQSQRCYPVGGNLMRSFGQDNLPNIAFQAAAGAKSGGDRCRACDQAGRERTVRQLSAYRTRRRAGDGTTRAGQIAFGQRGRGTKGQEIGTLGEDGVLVFALHASGGCAQPVELSGGAVTMCVGRIAGVKLRVDPLLLARCACRRPCLACCSPLLVAFACVLVHEMAHVLMARGVLGVKTQSVSSCPLAAWRRWSAPLQGAANS